MTPDKTDRSAVPFHNRFEVLQAEAFAQDLVPSQGFPRSMSTEAAFEGDICPPTVDIGSGSSLLGALSVAIAAASKGKERADDVYYNFTRRTVHTPSYIDSPRHLPETIKHIQDLTLMALRYTVISPLTSEGSELIHGEEPIDHVIDAIKGGAVVIAPIRVPGELVKAKTKRVHWTAITGLHNRPAVIGPDADNPNIPRIKHKARTEFAAVPALRRVRAVLTMGEDALSEQLDGPRGAARFAQVISWRLRPTSIERV
jgi:hypothetical protein